MSNSTNSLPGFAGRQLTAIAIGVAALGSASLNVWGASHIFPNPVTAVIFGTVIAACEVIAALTLRHILADYENHRYWKARAASVMLVLAIVGCVISGKQAFHVLFLEANANHKALEIRATARQDEATAYHARMLAGELDVSDSIAQNRWENKQEIADKAKLAELKAKPPHIAIVYVLLALFETLKIGGLWAIATPSTKGETHAQRRARKRRMAEAEAKSEAAHAERMAAIADAEVNGNVTPLRVTA